MIALLLLLIWLIYLKFNWDKLNINSRLVKTNLPVPGLNDMDDWLKLTEQQNDKLRSGTEKKIRWINGRQKTKLSILYLHGLSASAAEIYPVTELLADNLHANVYFARLSGHGSDGDDLAKATAEDWIQDVWHAWQIAESLGEKVVIIATSTGATVAEWLLSQNEIMEKLSCAVYLSPNFGINRPFSAILSWPLSQYWLPFVLGKEQKGIASNELQMKIWTQDYPIRVLRQMQRLVEAVCRMPQRANSVDLLTIYCEQDKVASAVKTKKYLKASNHKVSWMPLPQQENSNNHVLAGNAVTPVNNELVTKAVYNFVIKYGEKKH